jgi:hypothetical protein
MSRIYTVQFENVTITPANGDVDLFELRAADDKPINVVGVFLGQTTELADAAEEQLRLRVIRGNATSGSGGTTPTAIPVNPDDATPGVTADAVNPVIATTGTEVVLHSDTWNIRIPYNPPLTPEMYWKTNQAAGFIVLRLMAAVADDVTMSGTIYVEEQ